MPDEARSLDPQYAYDQMSQIIEELVQDRLLQYNAMKTDPYELEPCMLAAMPEKTVEADGSVTYLCRLKPDIHFHDDPCFPGGKGREVLTSDVLYAFQRICDPAVLCPVVETFEAHVIGMREAYDHAKDAGRFDYDHDRISGFETIDPHTFKLHLISPYPQILYWMAMYFTSPVAREGVAYYDGKPHPDGPHGSTIIHPPFAFHPVGTGPFRIFEHTTGQFYRSSAIPIITAPFFPAAAGRRSAKPLIARSRVARCRSTTNSSSKSSRKFSPFGCSRGRDISIGMAVMKDAANSAITTTRELAPKYAARGMTPQSHH